MDIKVNQWNLDKFKYIMSKKLGDYYNYFFS